MPPSSRTVPRSDSWLSVMPAIVSFRSWKTRWTELQQRFAGRRDADAAPDAQEDRLLQLVFEQQDLPADRRLRDVQLVAGGGERASLGNGANDFELAKVHAIPLWNTT